MSSRDSATNQDPPKRRLIHKRSLVIGIVSVILPWLALVIPGEVTECFGDHFEQTSMVHGWPLIHYDSCTTDLSYSVQPINEYYLKSAKQIIDESTSSQFEYNDSIWYRWQGNLPSAWTTPPNSYRMGRVRWFAAAINVSIALVVLALFIGLLEWRIRRKNGLLKFSLLEVVLMTTLIAVVLVWFSSEVDRARRQDQNRQMVESAFGKIHVFGRKHLVPSAILHFINKRNSLSFPLFEEISSILIIQRNSVNIDQEQIPELAKSFNELVDKVDLHLNADRNTLALLNKIEQGKVRRLELKFADHQAGKFVDDPAGFSNELVAKFPNLELLRIKFCSDLSQHEQLKPFLIFHDLTEVSLSELTMEGANFILSSAWSHETTIVVSDSPNKSKLEMEEIRDRLRSRFRVRSSSPIW